MVFVPFGPVAPVSLFEPRLLDMLRWAIFASGARCGRHAVTIATEGSMVLQMKTGPMSQVMSVVAMKMLR